MPVSIIGWAHTKLGKPAAPGEGAQAVDSGFRHVDGTLPLSPIGGSRAKGHPIAATGVSRPVMAAIQARDDAVPIPERIR